jgi:hypothetical protein
MKKLILLALLSIFTTGMFSQTLEKTISITRDTGYTSTYEIYEYITGKVIKYGVFDNITNTFTIYNNDHSVYKTVKVTIPSGSIYIEIKYASSHLFNTDDKIEFLLVTNADMSILSNLANPTPPQIILYNEDGTVITTFNNTSDAYAYVSSDNVFKLRTDFSVAGTYNSTTKKTTSTFGSKIYKLDGVVPTSLRSAKVTEDDDLAYPNPSNTIVNLPYHLEAGATGTMLIYGLGGNLIEQKSISGSSSILPLNVSAFAPGTYIYKYNNGSGRFIVQ